MGDEGKGVKVGGWVIVFVKTHGHEAGKSAETHASQGFPTIPQIPFPCMNSVLSPANLRFCNRNSLCIIAFRSYVANSVLWFGPILECAIGRRAPTRSRTRVPARHACIPVYIHNPHSPPTPNSHFHTQPGSPFSNHRNLPYTLPYKHIYTHKGARELLRGLGMRYRV